ncbi:TPA: endonuclease III domain-containing protein [Campylobacter jejuni]|uniref:endonuclease III domain-containing protein n=1 Tax=Campylobacter jejuni TaxID=197 RepID=UPI00119D6B3E|nr:endonuclease III domain-containing protein [Campylobacter jejuni]EAH8343179.1 endonuclease III domain-containing protein [Campylobacter jejuni]ECL2997650.1 endonuclease III domain-containing protein [Campylobacter jejuni]MBX0572438.1 endonuclease III domain-containing protein [Campylobacter jejuni]MBX0672178.1 endonuclease III domain-containing protein [Campylobacter jejuni]MBX1537128.1 endonuclease III domain-containing protein [Campylobacter jejuni]
MTGAQIFTKLLNLDLNYHDFDWLENQGLSEFELLISVVLTQNTNWKNVLKALENLKKENIASLEQINTLSNLELATLIKPSGFYNTKTKRLKGLVESIINTYENLENFKTNASREWLLNIKGLGFESVDSILNYLCKREILVVDNYSLRLAFYLGYEFENYEELREFFQSDIESEQENLYKILGKKCEFYELYQIFHALIVVFAKQSFKGQKLSPKGEEWIKILKEDL